MLLSAQRSDRVRHRPVMVAVIGLSSTVAADTPPGKYVLDEITEPTLIGVRPKPICGADADAYMKAHPQLEIILSAEVAGVGSAEVAR
jgi:hypothetical protein